MASSSMRGLPSVGNLRPIAKTTRPEIIQNSLLTEIRGILKTTRKNGKIEAPEQPMKILIKDLPARSAPIGFFKLIRR